LSDDKVLKSLLEIRSLVEDSINNTRSLTFELSPPALHELGITEAIRSLAEQLFEQHNIGLQFSEEPLPHSPSNDLSVVLYYAAREVFINIIKHSGADTVTVSICSLDDFIRVTVHDNGVGIANMPKNTLERKTSFGLFNIRERIMHLGGKVEIRSEPNGGTTVIFTVPIESEHRTQKEKS
jgi:two-component system, NarL family, sensor histidine kinase UhpB